MAARLLQVVVFPYRGCSFTAVLTHCSSAKELRPGLKRDFFDQGNSGRISRVSSALGFPSKTSAEIAPDHPKLSPGRFRAVCRKARKTRINIELCRVKWYSPAALGNGGNRFPLPAPAQINEKQWFTCLDDWMALRRRKRRGFAIDVFVKSRIIWQFSDGHERHINCARRFQEEIVRSSCDSSTLANAESS